MSDESIDTSLNQDSQHESLEATQYAHPSQYVDDGATQYADYAQYTDTTLDRQHAIHAQQFANPSGDNTLFGAQTHNSTLEAAPSTSASHDSEQSMRDDHVFRPQSHISGADLMQSLPEMRPNTSNQQQSVHNREEFTTVYDTIDHLEELLLSAKSTLFTPRMVKVDRDEIVDQLNALKDTLPVQLERASALMREAERRLENAQTQADAIVSSAQLDANRKIEEAQAQAEFLASQEQVTQIARQKANNLVANAQERADQLMTGANEYSLHVMQELQKQVDAYSRNIASGLQALNDRLDHAHKSQD